MSKFTKIIIGLVIAVVAVVVGGFLYVSLHQESEINKYNRANEAYKNTDTSKIEWATYQDPSKIFSFQYPKKWNVENGAHAPFIVSFKDPTIYRYEGPNDEMEVEAGSLGGVQDYYGEQITTTTDTFKVGNETGTVVLLPGMGQSFGVLIKHSNKYYLFSFPPKLDLSEVGNIEKYILGSVHFYK